MVVLHEIGHILSPDKSKCPETNRLTYHGVDFWKVVTDLYRQHGLLEFASTNEGYTRGQRYIKKLLGVAVEPVNTRRRRQIRKMLLTADA